MNCSCAVAVNEGAGDWCGGQQTRTARRTHACGECGGPILPGESYVFHTCFGNGRVVNHKVCTTCAAVVDQFFRDGFQFGWVWESLADHFCDNWRHDLPTSCIIKLPRVARDKVCDILQGIHENNVASGD